MCIFMYRDVVYSKSLQTRLDCYISYRAESTFTDYLLLGATHRVDCNIKFSPNI